VLTDHVAHALVGALLDSQLVGSPLLDEIVAIAAELPRLVEAGIGRLPRRDRHVRRELSDDPTVDGVGLGATPDRPSVVAHGRGLHDSDVEAGRMERIEDELLVSA